MNRIFYLLFLISFSVSSQKLSYSPYSYFGVGDTAFKASAENQMMGGVTAYADSIQVNLNNAASLSKLKLVNYSIGLELKNLSFDNNNIKQKSTAASLSYIAVSVPTKLFSFSFGLKPNSSVGYLLENNFEDIPTPELNRYEGDGGINSAFLSFGFELINNIGFGISSSYSFGSLNHYHSKILKDVELYTKVSNESSLSGLDYSFSTIYEGKIKDNLFLIGSFTFKPKNVLNSRNTQTISALKPDGGYGGETEIIDLQALGLEKTDVMIPATSIFGLGIGKDKKWFLGLGYKNIKEGGFTNKIMNLDNVSFKSSNQYSIGGFYIPKYDSFTNFFDTLTYRFGIRFLSSGLYVNNQQINDFGINFGVGIPVAGLSKANLGFELGQRGTNNAGLIKENYFSIKIGLSLNDIWFIKSLYN